METISRTPKTSIQKAGNRSANRAKKQLSELINNLTKPENISEQFIPGLLKKRRVKKRRKPNH